MFFLLSIFVFAADLELDITIGTILITGNDDDECFNLKYNRIDIQLAKTNELLIKGTSEHYSVNISITDSNSTLHLLFEEFSISAEGPAILIQGECNVNITICNDVSISSSNSCPIFVSNESTLYLEGKNENQFLTCKSYSNHSIIGGNGNIYVNNIEFNLPDTPILINGFQGQIISLNSCTLNISTYEETIGGLNTSLIIINSSHLNLNSQHSSCIGNSKNPDFEINIESSTVFAVTEATEAPCIGSNKISTSNCINIINSIVNGSIKSDESSSPVIGSSAFIRIDSSDLILKATKGSSIGGGQILKQLTTIEIINSSIKATSMGDSATIGGGEIEMSLEISIKNHSQILALNSNLLGKNGAAIGGGTNTIVELISIEESIVNCTSSALGSAIGCGNPSTGSYINKITIESSEIIAENKGQSQQYNAAGIGGHLIDAIKIINSNVSSKGSFESAGIGGSMNFSINEIFITQNCNIFASSMTTAAAIGASSHGSVNNITIIESIIDAFAGREIENQEIKGAGIGGGFYSSSKFIKIEKSNVKAISGYSSSAAGIGGGLMGTNGIIEIDYSQVISISSLDASRCNHENNGGSGIGSGSSINNENNAIEIKIRNSLISAFGSNIHTKSEASLPLICGSGIGHGGSDNSVMEIFIENSSVFAYGGNATMKETVASSAFLGGLIKSTTNDDKVSIINSNVFAVPGSAVECSLDVATSAFGLNFIPNSNELTGELLIENSIVYSNNENEEDAFKFLAVVFNKFSLVGSSEIEFHSSQNSPIVSNSETFSVAVLTLSNLRSLGISELTIYGEKIIFDKKISLKPNDNSISITLPFSNMEYMIYANINGNQVQITDESNTYNVFYIKKGHNFFNQIKLVGDEQSTTEPSDSQTQYISQSQSQYVSDSQTQYSSQSQYASDSHPIQYTENQNKPTQKPQNIPLILGLAIGIPVAVGIIVFSIAAYIIMCRKKKKDPLVIPAPSSDQNMTQPLNEQELEVII